LPEGAHVLPDLKGEGGGTGFASGATPEESRGWEGKPFVSFDGKDWPLGFAAEMLGFPEEDLRDLVRILGVPPSGVIRMASYRRQGRQPRAYPAGVLIRMTEAIRALREDLAA
jgi:hypothetical protein